MLDDPKSLAAATAQVIARARPPQGAPRAVNGTLTVVSVAFPFAPTGPDAVGGAEQVLWELDEGLVAAGHRSIVIARAGSACAGELVPIEVPAGPITDSLRAEIHDRVSRTLDRVTHTLGRPALVHMHGVDFQCYLPSAPIPVLVTLHLPLSHYPKRALAPDSRTWLRGVSESQTLLLPPGLAPIASIPNGVRLDWFSPLPAERRRYVVALGRICPEKGFEQAIDAARSAGAPMLLAGRVFPYDSHVRYFHDEIRPRLSSRCRFVGPVGRRRKRALLARARCLVVPSSVAETSSLVAMEALACGTPVVAFRCGALPEIVDHGETGFVVDDVTGMARAIRQVGAIDRRACRAAAERRFDVRVTIGRYIETYARLIRAAPTELGAWRA